MSGRIDAQNSDQEKSEEEAQKEPLRVDIDDDEKTTKVDICTDSSKRDAGKKKVYDERITFVMIDQKGLKSCCVLMCKNCSNCVELCKKIALTLSATINAVLIVFIVITLYDRTNDNSSGKSSHISPPQNLVQGEEGNRPQSVCMKCNDGGQRLQRQLQTVSRHSSVDLCCKEDATSIKILTTLIASDRKRQKAEDYLFLYFPSYVINGKQRRKTKDPLKTALKRDSLVSYPGNKIIAETTGNYVIFFALTQTSIRHGDVSVCVIRYREKEEILLCVSMENKRGVLTYNSLHVSEVFHFKSGDSIVIQMKGEENLYSFKQSNYFGMYRVS